MPIGPISYATSADSPLKAFSDSFGVGANVVSTQQAQQQNALALQNQQNMQADARAMGANPSPQNIASFAAKYPMLGDKVKPAYDMATEQQQQARLNQATPIYVALQNNRPDIAVKLFNNQADGYEAAGDKQNAASSRAMAQIVQADPNHAKALFGSVLALSIGPQKFADTFKTLNDVNATNAKLPAEIRTANAGATVAEANAGVAPTVAAATANKAVGEGQVAAAQGGAAVPMVQADLATKQVGVANTQSEIKTRKDQLELDRQKAVADAALKTQGLELQYGKVPDAAAKIRDDSAIAAESSYNTAQRFEGVADKFEHVNWGQIPLVNTFGAALSNSFGGEGAYKDLQNEYARLRASAIVSNMPQNISKITNKDIDIYSSGFPEPNAPPQRIVTFMRAMATVEQLNAITNDAKTQWISANRMGSLGPAKNTVSIEGITVPAGTKFHDFLNQYQTTKMQDYMQQRSNNALQNSGIMKYTTPIDTQPQPQIGGNP